MDVSAEHPLVMEEEQWSAHLMKVSFSMLSKVWLSSLWYDYGLPGMFALVYKCLRVRLGDSICPRKAPLAKMGRGYC